MMASMAGEMNDKQIHKLSRVHLNSKRLLDLINDLLDLAKIEAGVSKYCTTPSQCVIWQLLFRHKRRASQRSAGLPSTSMWTRCFLQYWSVIHPASSRLQRT